MFLIRIEYKICHKTTRENHGILTSEGAFTTPVLYPAGIEQPKLVLMVVKTSIHDTLVFLKKKKKNDNSSKHYFLYI